MDVLLDIESGLVSPRRAGDDGSAAVAPELDCDRHVDRTTPRVPECGDLRPSDLIGRAAEAVLDKLEHGVVIIDGEAR
ncbi:MAG TPA: hypothetical protein VLT59_05700, partial [Steroidobacteraceae bacterium]|nr:hypothetical protein [Steroidobacteraceae bacterium]